jgi:hypothetical protein
MNHQIRDKTKQSNVIQEQIYTATKKPQNSETSVDQPGLEPGTSRL